MTPTLAGRWQTRLFLALFAGGPVTLFYMTAFGMLAEGPASEVFWKLPALLTTSLVLGLAWDALYIYLQGFRWDRDWPLAFQFASGAVEGALLFALFAGDLVPFAQFADGDAWRFALHYTTVWQCSYWALFGPLRVLFPRWRFRGGRIL